MKRRLSLVVTVLLLIITGVSCGNKLTDTERTIPNIMEYSLSDVINKALEAVVFIEHTYMDLRGNIVQVHGSGVILRPDGYILTNRHVVENAQTVTITTINLENYETTEILLDDTQDLAVLKIEGNNLPSIPFTEGEEIRIGDWVIALGYPLGVAPTEGGAAATVGIISSLKRSFFIECTPFYDVIQTDAAINTGNSGGPLINTKGEIVGINTAVDSEGTGISFAINIATARHVFEDLVTFGNPQHPYLGVSLADVALSGGGIRITGAQVTFIEPGSPADVAGFKVNDVITNFDGQTINFISDLMRQLWRRNVSDEIPVNVFRGTSVELKIILGIRPETGLCQTQTADNPSARF